MPIASLTLLLAAAGPFVPQEASVHWRNSVHSMGALPAELPAPAAVALEQWAPWADARGYELHLGDDARVLFVARQPTDGVKQLIAATCAYFDERLPAPARETAASSGALRTPGPGGLAQPAKDRTPLPEDPGSGRTSTSLSDALYGTPRWETVWGAGEGPLDHDTIVLLAVDQQDYDGVLDQLVASQPSLSGWAQETRAGFGFVLESPPVGAWVFGVEGQEEWDSSGELVHRLTDLLLLRRFGRQPYWIAQGLAWAAEMKLRGAIFCYPFRDEFVYAVEHAAWPLEVRNRLKKEFKQRSLTIGDLAGLRRGAWDGQAARLAYSSMAWLLETHPAALVRVLEDLRLAYAEGSRIDRTDGTWERDTAFEVPAAVVEQTFFQHVGDGVFDELTEALRAFR